jgi:PhzF family phenazine biosynthesis protein
MEFQRILPFGSYVDDPLCHLSREAITGVAMSVPFFLVDAFADRPFTGNPAAVVPLSSWKDDGWLHCVAREMNQSETAFVVKRQQVFDLRWFTPTIEVNLCGHATLAAAEVLWDEGLAKRDEEIRFSTRSGILRAVCRGDRIELDFPLTPEEAAEAAPGLAEALGVLPIYVGKSQFDFLIEVESEAVLRSVSPDFKRLATVPARGIIVTSRSANDEFDFVSRFFAPASGIDEDPVTGSAHCCLGAFWRKRLKKSEFLAYQASARGGVVSVRVTEDRAFLGGKAVVVAKGELLVETTSNDTKEPLKPPS